MTDKPVLNKIMDAMFFKGGIVATGAFCLALSKNECLPPCMEKVSYGIISLGVAGVLIGMRAKTIKEEEERKNKERKDKQKLEQEPVDDDYGPDYDDPRYHEEMAQFYFKNRSVEKRMYRWGRRSKR